MPMNFCYVQQFAQTRTGLSAQVIFEGTQFVSYASTFETQITFCNTHTTAVAVQWLDFGGKRVQYTSLQPSDTYTQATFKTHPWVITEVGKPDSKH